MPPVFLFFVFLFIFVAKNVDQNRVSTFGYGA